MLSKPSDMPEKLSEIVTLCFQFTVCWYNAVSA